MKLTNSLKSVITTKGALTPIFVPHREFLIIHAFRAKQRQDMTAPQDVGFKG